MGRGTRYAHVQTVLGQHYNGGRVLELGAGGAVYRELFSDYVATDLPTTPYAAAGDLDVCCDARRLPFADGSFGLCFAVASLCLIPRVHEVFREVERCLRPGGTFLIFDYTRATQLALADRHRQQGQDVHLNLWTGAQLETLLHGASFVDVRRLETKPYWQAIVTAWPGFGDRYRYWLMIAARRQV